MQLEWLAQRWMVWLAPEFLLAEAPNPYLTVPQERQAPQAWMAFGQPVLQRRVKGYFFCYLGNP
ncbi:MAG: hypothetical protein EA353_07765 [Puniceicoccaceae bacterium]|nr:MAG: hypothetical protein EA353_07765 [Puniceicoccaceae bacterium]